MSYTTPPISAAQQQTIIKNTNIAVAKFAKSYADKLGVKRLFTKEDIEDIVCNTLYKACRSFDCYNPAMAKLSTWVSRIALNCVITAYEYKFNRIPISYALTLENEDGDEFDRDEVYDGRKGCNQMMSELFSEFEADRDLERREFEACIRKQTGKLSEKNQRFELMLEDGYAPKDMAAVGNCSADAAGKRIWIIRQTLREPVKKIAEEFGVPFMKYAC